MTAALSLVHLEERRHEQDASAPGGESTWFSGVPRERSRTGDAEGHTHELVEQLRKIVEEGMPAWKFTLVERSGTARAVHGATARFHGPALAPQ